MAVRHLAQLDGMVWMAEQYLFLIANDQDDQLVNNEVSSGDSQDVLLADLINSRAIRFPILRVLRVTPREFILRESARDLGFAAERARESINKSSLGRIQLAVGHWLCNDALDL